jgi:hypothetical protein
VANITSKIKKQERPKNSNTGGMPELGIKKKENQIK